LTPLGDDLPKKLKKIVDRLTAERKPGAPGALRPTSDPFQGAEGLILRFAQFPA
jgi:hypothetical protein